MLLKDWLIDWFENNTDLNKEEIIENSAKNYFEEGWIDSFKFITFISDVEESFNIRFSNEEFQNRAFATIDGLNSIISGKIHEQKK